VSKKSDTHEEAAQDPEAGREEDQEAGLIPDPGAEADNF